MIEAALRTLTSMDEVETVHFLEKDGFLIYAYGDEAVEDASGNITRWQTLIEAAEEKATITLVMEHGYVILQPVGNRILVVKCTRRTNLGALRTTIRQVHWPS